MKIRVKATFDIKCNYLKKVRQFCHGDNETSELKYVIRNKNCRGERITIIWNKDNEMHELWKCLAENINASINTINQKFVQKYD